MRKLLDGRILDLLRGDLEHLLYAQIANGVEVRFGMAIERVEQDDRTVRATFTDGRVEVFDLLVGRDGVHSRVRDLAFGKEETFARLVGYTAAAFVVPDAPGLADPHAFYTLTLAERQVNVYLLPGGRWATLFLYRTRTDGANFSRDAARQEPRRVFGDFRWIVPALLDGLERVAEVHFDQAEQIELSRWSEGRVALVGDAAGCVSLLAGQGASLAVAGAAVLAAELAAKTTSPRRSPATRPGSSRSCSARRRAGANSPAGSSPTAASGSGCAT